MKKLSLKIRLILSFTGIAAVIWMAAAIISWQESKEQIDEFFDTYQLHLARQLAAADWRNLSAEMQENINRQVKNLDDDGDEDDEALGFAVFNSQGKMIFNDNEKGQLFPYLANATGFANYPLGHKHKLWRIVNLRSADGNFTIAVGQELEYRQEAALEVVEETLLPWLGGLLLLMLMTVGLVNSELRPLRKLTETLSRRTAGDFSALPTGGQASEIIPLIDAMNRLFAKIDNLITRERSFIADAAHELRSPLTALKVQLEVAQLSGDDPKTCKQALLRLGEGIERGSRLVEQLLILSRLEAGAYTTTSSSPDWQELLTMAVAEQESAAAAKRISFDRWDDSYPLCAGETISTSLLLRNILDNAVRYSVPQSKIEIVISKEKITVSNPAPQINNHNVSRLGERFFRPPGQEQTGSGLGLSIVKKIAALHGWKAIFEVKEGRFFAIIIFNGEG